jgi:ATP-dependent Clp protease ATP-binding subunit ClpC
LFCENCKKRPATMRMTLGKQDGEQQTIMLCGMCAHRFRAVVPSRMALGAHSGGQLSPEVFSQHQFPTQRYGVFAGFSRQTQEVLREAEKTARGQGLQAVGTGPLLYGIMQLGYSPALHALEKNGVHKEELEATIPPSVSELENTDQPIQLSPDTLSVLEMAQNEAAGLNDTFVEPEHIILGMLELENVSATQWMRNHGVDFGCLERDILESLSRGRPPADDRFMNILEATPEEILLGPDTSTGPGTSTRKALLAYARDLTALAKAGKMMPVVGREAEVGRVIRILSRLQKNNPLLLGKAGVGKTAIVEALAQQIVAGDVPRRLRGASLYQVDLTAMLAGTEMRGEFEKRVKGLLDEVSGRSDCILFIDEIHTLLGAGATEGSLDAGNMMKPALARGELRLIGATTTSEHSKYIERDPALSRRFQPVLVGEPTVEQAIFILEGIKGRFESHHGVSVSDEAISAAVTLSAQYLTDRFLPDKAIDLIDESASMVAIENDDTAESRVVIADDVARVISSWTGIPLTKLVESEKQRLLDMEGIIHRRIINQDEAVGVVSDVVRRSRAGLRDPGRPNGAFIFAGPTGVGKTELARALAEFIFNDERALIRLDMSEYTEAESVSRLIGAPPGYVGFEQGGQLTEKVKFQPYSVVLLDEMEKAHPRVLNVLLQIADAGRLTDGQGREVNFKNTIIILTTNIGSHLYFASGNTEEPAALKEQVIDLIVKSTSPELINRMDAVILFEALTLEQVREIIGLHLERLARRLAERSINLELGEGAVDYLAGKGFDPEMGARPAKRVIQNELESPLSGMILDGSLGDGQTAVVSAAGDHLEITVAA